MESGCDAKQKTLPRSWAFHPAGELHSHLWREYHGFERPDGASQKELFDATKILFVDAGETLLAHLTWREQELLLLCLEIIGQCEYKLNPEHPYFTSSPQDWECLLLEDTYIPPVKEPSFTRLELEATAADWYLNTKQETGFRIPVDAKHKDDWQLPESVQYYRWTNCVKSQNPEGKIEESSTEPAQEELKRLQADKPLTWDDLEGADLDNKAVCELILAWLEEIKNPKGQCIDSINDALKEAQRAASKTFRQKNAGCPVRLRIYSNDFFFHRLAMVKVGHRGGPSSTYRRIKQSEWGF
jgi:hypothetical protein